MGNELKKVTKKNVSSTGICSIRTNFRFNAVLMRDRFDRNKDIKDMRVARTLVEEGEAELFAKQHPQPFLCMF